MKRLSLIVAACALACTAGWCVTVPINGGFERGDGTVPAGWLLDGPWEMVGNQKCEGRRSVAIYGYESLRGDRLASDSGMVVRAGRPITLVGYYRGSGLAAGIEIVDRLGAVLEALDTGALEPAESWTRFSITYERPADFPAYEFAYARAFCEVVSDGAEGAFDDVKFLDPPGFTPSWDPLAPVKRIGEGVEEDKGNEEKPVQSGEAKKVPVPPPPPNLVPNSGLSGYGSPQGWASFGAAEQLSWQPGQGGRSGSLTITGGEETCGWYADLQRMDISVPHELSLQAEVSEAGAGPARAVLLVFDPDRTKVYSHVIVPLSEARRRVCATVSPVEKLSASGLGRLELVAPGGLTGRVSVSQPSLKADPHQPSVKAARQDFAIFPDPKKVSFFAKVPNAIDQVTEMVTHLKVLDRDRATVEYEKRKMAVAARAVALFPASPKLKYNGAYTLLMRVEASDGSRSFAYGEYPFVVCPADGQDPKNPCIGVVLSGDSAAEVQAAAMAGVGWVAAPIEYADDPSSHAVRARMRQLRDLGDEAHRYGMSFAVKVRLGGGSAPHCEEFMGFFEALNSRLGSLADAYVLDCSPRLLAADGSRQQIAAVAAVIRDVQETSGSATKSTILTPFGTAETIQEALPAAQDTPGTQPDDKGKPATEGTKDPLAAIDLQFGPVTEKQPVAEATATDTAAPAAATDAPLTAPMTPPQPQSGPVYVPSYVGDCEQAGNWLLPLTAPAEERGAGCPRDALTARQAVCALAGDCALVFWDNTGEASLLDGDGNATPCWAALWAMCQQLRGKSFASREESDDGVACLRFGGDAGDTLVMWAERGQKSTVLVGELAGATKVDIGGQEWPLSFIGGRAQVALTGDPLYVNVRSGAAVSIGAASFTGPRY